MKKEEVLILIMAGFCFISLIFAITTQIKSNTNYLKFQQCRVLFNESMQLHYECMKGWAKCLNITFNESIYKKILPYQPSKQDKLSL